MADQSGREAAVGQYVHFPINAHHRAIDKTQKVRKMLSQMSLSVLRELTSWALEASVPSETRSLAKER